MIESVNNKYIKYLTKLKDKKYILEEKRYLIEGLHLVMEAKKAGVLEKVITLQKTNNFDDYILVNEKIMKKLSSLKTPTNIIGVCKIKESDKIFGKVALLDNIQDPGNLGTIIRSAVAFNIDTLILSKDTVNLYNQKVLRASEGMIFHQNIIISDLTDALEKLKNDGYKVYSTDVSNGEDLNQIIFPVKSAIILGNEGSGVNNKIKALATNKLNIKINESCESLNVAIAASIIFYKLNI